MSVWDLYPSELGEVRRASRLSVTVLSPCNSLVGKTILALPEEVAVPALAPIVTKTSLVNVRDITSWIPTSSMLAIVLFSGLTTVLGVFIAAARTVSVETPRTR